MSSLKVLFIVYCKFFASSTLFFVGGICCLRIYLLFSVKCTMYFLYRAFELSWYVRFRNFLPSSVSEQCPPEAQRRRKIFRNFSQFVSNYKDVVEGPRTAFHHHITLLPLKQMTWSPDLSLDVESWRGDDIFCSHLPPPQRLPHVLLVSTLLKRNVLLLLVSSVNNVRVVVNLVGEAV